jgi:hypothetical protein
MTILLAAMKIILCIVGFVSAVILVWLILEEAEYKGP